MSTRHGAAIVHTPRQVCFIAMGCSACGYILTALLAIITRVHALVKLATLITATGSASGVSCELLMIYGLLNNNAVASCYLTFVLSL
jgi:hypothetical protein